MNFGDCPYCNDFTGFFKVPKKTPCYGKVECESCGKEIWYKFSRIAPESWTIEDFEKEFNVDHINRKISPKDSEKETYDKVVNEIVNLIKKSSTYDWDDTMVRDVVVEIMKEELQRLYKEEEDRILWGDSAGQKPAGILSMSGLILKEKKS